MSAMLFGVAAVALLMLAAAIWLWHTSTARSQRSATAAFVEMQLGRSTAQAVAASSAAHQPFGTGPRRAAGIAGWWDNVLLRAGVQGGAGFYAPLLIALVVIPLLALLVGGVLGALIGLGMVVAACAFHLWLKMTKRLQKMVQQLPGFIDSLVRLITIGNSLSSAFHTAVPLVEAPLVEVLDRANQLNRAGMELDTSLLHASRLYRFYELELVAAVVGVALRFGGRSDMVLERMAGFMRDLQAAREELHALSAEVRLSAWILAGLPVFVAGFIIIFNNALFMGMWNDPVGRRMLLGAVVLQVCGSFWLYRLAKLS